MKKKLICILEFNKEEIVNFTAPGFNASLLELVRKENNPNINQILIEVKSRRIYCYGYLPINNVFA